MQGVKAMNRLIDVKKQKVFSFEATPSDLNAVEERFDFESVPFIKGEFTIRRDDSVIPCLVLEGNVTSSVKHNNQDINVEDKIELYLVKHEDDIEKFDIQQDVEILEDDKINIGEVIAQYIYLNVTNSDE
ncbi:MAG: hypothetical protein H6850_02570 [Alphaproteobacteria bacterium]|nr:MAG: hypothetical protein H6850_02570 [Alphaproteobacteria bacterium]